MKVHLEAHPITRSAGVAPTDWRLELKLTPDHAKDVHEFSRWRSPHQPTRMFLPLAVAQQVNLLGRTEEAVMELADHLQEGYVLWGAAFCWNEKTAPDRSGPGKADPAEAEGVGLSIEVPINALTKLLVERLKKATRIDEVTITVEQLALEAQRQKLAPV
jgi:hypothetical protein